MLFLQFPRIILFNERFSLTDQLPDRITNEVFSTDTKNAVLQSFISLLDEDAVQTFLRTNDPDDSIALREAMQKKLDVLIGRVNQHARDSGENKDLLEMTLHPNKNGLQITVKTDKKKSFYSHLSDNTKFLFAYYLYQQAHKIKNDILLFDEPSNGFHPTAQEFILNFLRLLADDQNLVVVATHSEHLIDPMRLSGVRIMSLDPNNHIVIKNHFYDRATQKGDYLALQPIMDAIGLRYSRQINIQDRVIITEGITDMLYLKAFNSILGLHYDLHFAPARGASQITSLIPLLISQGLSFKVVIDKGDIKDQIQRAFGIDEKFIWEVPIPPEFETIRTSGIEDLLSKKDFERIMKRPVEQEFKHVSNSFYIREEVFKRQTASTFYENYKAYKMQDFEDYTRSSFHRVLEFCHSDDWFSI